jgi:predicted Rossmann-fold nucleotide-binding protein
MTLDASAYIFLAGGFGTLDELFEMLVLEQTHKIPKAPIILVGSDFWKAFDKVIQEQLLTKYQTIEEADRQLYEILDDHDEIVKRIKTYERKLNQ